MKARIYYLLTKKFDLPFHVFLHRAIIVRGGKEPQEPILTNYDFTMSVFKFTA